MYFLLVVTSDHAHTMSISGYPERGNPIGGLNSIVSEVGKSVIDSIVSKKLVFSCDDNIVYTSR